MDNERLLELIAKMEKGTATEAELLELDEAYAKFETKTGFTDDFNRQQVADYESQLFSKISHRLNPDMPKKKADYISSIRVLAALLILLVSAGIFHLSKTKRKYDSQQIAVKKDVAAGTNKAILTLSDGSSISLTDATAGKLTGDSGANLTKTKDGKLIYEQSAVGTSSTASNTVSTPRGGQYQVVLPDGTHAWLNAGSSLTYPVSFSAAERKVKMTGEIYFEVAKVQNNKRRVPFIVVTEDQQVEVLGTHFNINAYKEGTDVQTTLAEGSVRVKPNGAIAKLLKPGQQSSVLNGSIKIQEADLENTLAWKNGLFHFQDADLKTVMRQLERWYDVQIDYQNIPALHFNGGISRKVPLSQVLKMLEITGDIHFTISGKNVKVRSAQ